MLTIKQYVKASSLEEAYELNQEEKQCGSRRYAVAEDAEEKCGNRH